MAKLSLSPPTIPRSAPPTAAEHAAAVDDAREEAASAALAAAADFATGPRTRTPPRAWSSWATSGRASPRKPPDHSFLCSGLSHVKHGRFDP